MKLIDGAFLMRHEYAACALVELMQIGKAPSSADPVLQHAPEAFDGIQVVAATGRSAIQPKPLVPVGQRRCELMRPVAATAVGHHDHLFAGVAKAGHHLMDILPEPLRIKLRDALIKDLRGPILDGTNDAEQYAAGHATPTPIASPRLTFEGLFAFDLAGPQRPSRQTIPLGFAVPPACPGEGETPENGFIFIQQNDLAATRAIFQRCQVKRRPRQLSGSGTEAPRGPVVADVFFLTPRGHFRG